MGAFAGDLARRRRAKFVPGDSARTVHQTKEPQHKDDFDEWLARIVSEANFGGGYAAQATPPFKNTTFIRADTLAGS